MSKTPTECEQRKVRSGLESLKDQDAELQAKLGRDTGERL